MIAIILFPVWRKSAAQQRHGNDAVLPRYQVILHSHPMHGVRMVINALVSAVPLSLPEAQRISQTAQQHGQAVVIVCPREVAEYYKERLETYDLTITLALA